MFLNAHWILLASLWTTFKSLWTEFIFIYYLIISPAFIFLNVVSTGSIRLVFPAFDPKVDVAGECIFWGLKLPTFFSGENTFFLAMVLVCLLKFFLVLVLICLLVLELIIASLLLLVVIASSTSGFNKWLIYMSIEIWLW